MKCIGKCIAVSIVISILCCACGETPKTPKPEKVQQAEYQAKLDALRPTIYGDIEGLSPEPGTCISIIGRNAGDSFWGEVQAGAEQAIKDLNEQLGYTGKDKIILRYVAPKERDNVDEQINILDEELDNAPLAIGIAAADATACITQFDYAKEYGIPIVMLDSGSEYQDVAATCATDNVDAARVAATQLADAIEGNGEVLLFIQDSVSQTAKDRETGFLEGLKKYPNIKVAKTFRYDDYSKEAKKIAKSLDIPVEEVSQDRIVSYILEQYPDVKGILAANLDSTQHVVHVLDKLEKKDVKVVGFDGGKEQLELLDEGKIEGLILQNPFGMGYATVVAIIRAAYSMGNEAMVDSSYVWITKENLDDEEVVGLLY